MVQVLVSGRRPTSINRSSMGGSRKLPTEPGENEYENAGVWVLDLSQGLVTVNDGRSMLELIWEYYLS